MFSNAVSLRIGLMHIINISCCAYYTGDIKTEADSNDITEHSHDDKPRPYVCTVCDKWFAAKGGFNDHKLTHSGEKLHSCSKCGKCFISQSRLNQHRNIHTSRYKCPECGRCCASSTALEVHWRCHSGEKPFECNVCSKQFRRSDQLLLHSRSHSGEKPYTCLMCYKAFGHSGHLKRHMTNVHASDIICSVSSLLNGYQDK